MSQEFKDPVPSHWDERTNIQKTKHDIIREYINGWFPKIGQTVDRVVYFDTHAGRGEFHTGEDGSPIVALKTVLNHEHLDRILARTQIDFHFMEWDENNLKSLQEKISQLGELPKGINIIPPSHGNCIEVLRGILSELQQSKNQSLPAFFFIDPYNFEVPVDLLKDIMSFKMSEVYLNLMWRNLNQALGNAFIGLEDSKLATWVNKMDQLIGCRDWQTVGRMTQEREKADSLISLIQSQTNVRWNTYIKMLFPNGAIDYILLHLTNSSHGRNLMKDCLWKIAPDETGNFHVKQGESDDDWLIKPECDMGAVQSWVLEQLKNANQQWSELAEKFLDTIWREVHLNDAIKSLRKANKIEGKDFKGQFSKSSNPLLSLHSQPELF